MFKFKNLTVAAIASAALVLPVSGALILATPLQAEAKKSKKEKVEGVEIAAGTEIKGKLTDGLDSSKNTEGDTFTLKISTGWFGDKALKGAMINGHVENVKSSKMGGKKGAMELVFDEIEMPNGHTTEIDAQLTALPKPKGKFLQSAAIVMGGAVAGHHIGKKTNKKHGALMGAAAATAVALSLPGGDIVLKKGSELKIKLKDAVTVTAE